MPHNLTLSQLPDTIVTLLSVVPLLSCYRNILAHTLYSPHLEGKVFPLLEPCLALLPQIVDSIPLLHLASQIWDKKWRIMKRADKKSFTVMRERFTETCLVVWPLLYHRSNGSNNLNAEAFKIAAVEELKVDGALSFLTKNSENAYFTPFSTHELQYIYG